MENGKLHEIANLQRPILSIPQLSGIRTVDDEALSRTRPVRALVLEAKGIPDPWFPASFCLHFRREGATEEVQLDLRRTAPVETGASHAQYTLSQPLPIHRIDHRETVNFELRTHAAATEVFRLTLGRGAAKGRWRSNPDAAQRYQLSEVVCEGESDRPTGPVMGQLQIDGMQVDFDDYHFEPLLVLGKTEKGRGFELPLRWSPAKDGQGSWKSIESKEIKWFVPSEDGQYNTAEEVEYCAKAARGGPVHCLLHCAETIEARGLVWPTDEQSRSTVGMRELQPKIFNEVAHFFMPEEQGLKIFFRGFTLGAGVVSLAGDLRMLQLDRPLPIESGTRGRQLEECGPFLPLRAWLDLQDRSLRLKDGQESIVLKWDRSCYRSGRGLSYFVETAPSPSGRSFSEFKWSRSNTPEGRQRYAWRDLVFEVEGDTVDLVGWLICSEDGISHPAVGCFTGYVFRPGHSPQTAGSAEPMEFEPSDPRISDLYGPDAGLVVNRMEEMIRANKPSARELELPSGSVLGLELVQGGMIELTQIRSSSSRILRPHDLRVFLPAGVEAE